MNVALPFKFDSVIEVEILKTIRIRDFETELFVGSLAPSKIESFAVLKEPRKIWILVSKDNRLRGLQRRDWLRHWHEDRVQIRKRQGKKWREYFNANLKRDLL